MSSQVARSVDGRRSTDLIQIGETVGCELRSTYLSHAPLKRTERDSSSMGTDISYAISRDNKSSSMRIAGHVVIAGRIRLRTSEETRTLRVCGVVSQAHPARSPGI